MVYEGNAHVLSENVSIYNVHEFINIKQTKSLVQFVIHLFWHSNVKGKILELTGFFVCSFLGDVKVLKEAHFILLHIYTSY